MSNYPLAPANLRHYPWQEGCSACQWFRENPDPGLSTWLLSVASHFDRKHDVQLVGS